MKVPYLSAASVRSESLTPGTLLEAGALAKMTKKLYALLSPDEDDDAGEAQGAASYIP